MIRRDYILRMIEEFVKALARIRSLKKDQRWNEAEKEVEGQLCALTGLSAEQLLQLSENELLANICDNEPTQSVRTKMLILTTVLNEAGDVATAKGGVEIARQYYLKALNVLLSTLAREDVFDFPEFVPAVEKIALNLEDAPIPFGTLSLLMYHYERTGQFDKAEDALFEMFEDAAGSPALRDFALAFYERLLSKSDAVLTAGNLPRSEAQDGLDQLRRKSASASL